MKPKFFNESLMSKITNIRHKEVNEEGLKVRHSDKTQPAHRDQEKMALFIIDAQNDFCVDSGTLFVPGSVEDNVRISNFIFKNLDNITNIMCTLDTHYIYQIFHPLWWIDQKGNHPDPFTLITADDIKSGKWMALKDPKWSLEYCEKLESQGKKNLCIWPEHCLLGTPGHAIVSALHEAIMYNSIGRTSMITYLTKGTLPNTEYYSIFSPEVKVNHPQGQFNTKFFKALVEHDKIYIAGQASSHCVLESILDMQKEMGGDKDLINKVYILEDCMSPVPNIEDQDGNTIVNFKQIVQDSFEQFKQDGMHIVKSIDDI